MEFDTSTKDQFFQYYKKQSQSAETIARFERLADLIFKTLEREGRKGPFEVADIGGGVGALSSIFARAGHSATCIDISESLLELGRERSKQEGLEVNFVNCSATDTPLQNQSVDICVVPELLEHVAEWESCLDEAARILRPGGLLYLSTTNKLCPSQEEFSLPLYSWYPGSVKRYYEKLSVTTRPEIVNYTKYPAVNWFTYYSLKKALRSRGFNQFFDRLDMIEIRLKGSAKAGVARWLRHIPLCRLGLQLITSASLILALKSP